MQREPGIGFRKEANATDTYLGAISNFHADIFENETKSICRS